MPTALRSAPREAAPLDRFLPKADVRERHEVVIHAPPRVVMRTARALNLRSVPGVGAIFGLRERIMGGFRRPEPTSGLVDEMRGLGWGVLEEEEGHLCAGAVCQPWLADVVFTPGPAGDFRGYAEPGRVKIAWTLEVEPLEPGWTRFATETRAVATDAAARARFRRYWRFVRPGVVLIRRLMLPALRRQAERQAQTTLSPF